MSKFKNDLDAKLAQGYKLIDKKLHISVFGADNVSISVLGLSVRADNALKRSGLKTTTEIIAKWDDLGKVRGMGIGTVKEVKNAVLNYYYDNMTEAQKEIMWEKLLATNIGGKNE